MLNRGNESCSVLTISQPWGLGKWNCSLQQNTDPKINNYIYFLGWIRRFRLRYGSSQLASTSESDIAIFSRTPAEKFRPAPGTKDQKSMGSHLWPWGHNHPPLFQIHPLTINSRAKKARSCGDQNKDKIWTIYFLAELKIVNKKTSVVCQNSARFSSVQRGHVSNERSPDVVTLDVTCSQFVF